MNKRDRGGKTTWFQREAMLQWLEVEANYKLMTGEATHGMKLVVAGAKVTKNSAYQDLAHYVNQKCGTSWDGKTSQSRFRAYKRLYLETKKKYEDPTGPKFCLSEAEISKGCNTIEKKLDVECPGYARMDTLFGMKQNVKPHSTMQSGLNLLIQASEWDSDSDIDDPVDADTSRDAETRLDMDLGDLHSCSGNEERTPEALTMSAVVTDGINASNARKGKRSDDLPDALKSLCSATVKEHSDDLPNKLSEGKRQKQAQGLTAAYSEAKKAEFKLVKEQLEWKIQHDKELLALNKENNYEEIRIKQREVDVIAKAVTEQTKRELTLKLIDQGKTPLQIQEYLEVFG